MAPKKNSDQNIEKTLHSSIKLSDLESALSNHPQISEAVVLAFPREIKGQGTFAFVVLKEGLRESRSLRRELIQYISQIMGPMAKPDHLFFSQALPKTRNGKVMRSTLKQIAAGSFKNLRETHFFKDSQLLEKILEKLNQEEEDDEKKQS